MPRLSEKAIGTRDATSTAMISLRRNPGPAAAAAANATGVSTAILPPQLFV